MKTKAVVFGIGSNYEAYASYLLMKYDVIALVDNDSSKHGQRIGEGRITTPDAILALKYDTIFVMPDKPVFYAICTQLMNMGVPLEKIKGVTDIEAERGMYQYRSIFGLYNKPKAEKLASSVCRPTDLVNLPEWKSFLSGINQGSMPIDAQSSEYALNRKTWEFVYICQALYERGVLKEGAKGLGFAVGKEPLSSIFARFGCKITATDAPLEISGEVWAASNQHSDSASDVHHAHIIDKATFENNVSFKYIDMNSIPNEERGYDFIWSACALEHLGSLHMAKDFIYKAMNCLKPGGVAVHTTEFNLTSSFNTIHKGNAIVLRSVDLIDIAENLAWQGHSIEPLDFRLDGSEEDDYVAYPPCTEHHFKILLHDYVTTSFGIIAYNSGAAL